MNRRRPMTRGTFSEPVKLTDEQAARLADTAGPSPAEAIAARKAKLGISDVAAGVRAAAGATIAGRVAELVEGEGRALVTVRDYKLNASTVLRAFEGVCDDEEVCTVLALRLRRAVETFIATGSNSWQELFMLMCAYQDHSNRRRERRAAKAGA